MVQSPLRVFTEIMVCKQPYMSMHLYQEIKNQICNIIVYVDDLNLVGTPKELTRTTKYLKNEFEMQDLEKTKILSQSADQVFPY